MDPVRLAVIGAGAIGARHAEVAAACAGGRLVAVCDPAPHARELAQRLGARHHAEPRDLLAAGGVDGVVVATPTATHAAMALSCLRAGLHVLVEKPLATTVDEGARMVEAARVAGCHLLVGHQRRFNPLVETARELVQGGSLGRLIAVNAVWALQKPDDYFRVRWRTEPGGGPVLTNLVHDVDLLRWVCGDMERIYAETSQLARAHEVEDTVSVTVRFASGALGAMLCTDATPAPWSYELTTGENPAYPQVPETCYQFLGTRGSLAFPSLRLWRYPDAAHSGWMQPLERSERTVPAADPLVRQMEHFCRVIRGEETPRTPGPDGLRTLEATLAVLQAAGGGEPVALRPPDP